MTRPNITAGEWSWQGLGKNKVMPRRYYLNAFHGQGLAVRVLESEEEVWPNHPDAKAITAIPYMLAALENNYLRMERRYIEADLRGTPIPDEKRNSEYHSTKAALIKAGYTFP